MRAMKKPDYTKPDFYARKAKAQGFPARSVFKLEELDRRFKVLAKGMRVLDLGAAPGSWMKYASDKVGPGGLVAGIDRNRLSRQLHPNEVFYEEDVFDTAPAKLKEEWGTFDLVLSDLAPDTSGQKATDALRSVALAEQALKIAETILKPGGSLLLKVFQGPGFDGFYDLVREKFESVSSSKPKSSRPNSVEMFIFCKSKK